MSHLLGFSWSTQQVLEQPAFSELILRLRGGDPTAAAELIREYEPQIRRIASMRLRGTQRRLFDSLDISQSVLGDFWKRFSSGGGEAIDTPEKLTQTLAMMTCHKIIDKWRRSKARVRSDPDHPLEGAEGLSAAAAPDPSPSRVLALRELVQLAKERFSEHERQLAELRCLGRTWTEIGSELGAKPDSLRIQFARAALRVARELHLSEVIDV